MSRIPLATKYRPQRFSEVAGQKSVRDILSRAAREDRVAPAYLFSGTRGVGKTTLARIFARALNCVEAPASEPCGQCIHCRQIAAGMETDVIEMDAASNTGVDDVRALKENVGFSPLNCRYKVFIIDEAHMLSKNAFNALLKTLEEPPRGVTFIMATTEAHKFLPTIVSRCQHYVFKRLSLQEIEDHLVKVLQMENLDYEEKAVGLIARRASGSVRDGMSLLSQVLALGVRRLTAGDVREILGLAGQEVMLSVLEGIRNSDCSAIVDVVGRILDRGLDIGFFLNELTVLWRNVFLLSQSGRQIIPSLSLSEEEAEELLALSGDFSLTHVHACWQMTLEGRRRILTSVEPALALELLLLNLALFPKLIAVENFSPRGNKPADAPAGRSAPVPPPPARTSPPPRPQASLRDTPAPPPYPQDKVRREEGVSVQPPVAPSYCPEPETFAPGPSEALFARTKNWNGFLDYYEEERKKGRVLFPGIKNIDAAINARCITLKCPSNTCFEMLSARDKSESLHKLIRNYFGAEMEVAVLPPQGAPTVNGADLKEKVLAEPLSRELKDVFNAELVSTKPRMR